MPRPSRPGHEFAIINCDPHPGVANSPQWILMPSLLSPSFSHAQLDSRGCWLRLPCVRGLKCGSNVISNGPRPIESRLIRIITCATYKTVSILFNVNVDHSPSIFGHPTVYEWTVWFLSFDLPVNCWGPFYPHLWVTHHTCPQRWHRRIEIINKWTHFSIIILYQIGTGCDVNHHPDFQWKSPDSI